jgi:teichoic acid transport system permease protein
MTAAVATERPDAAPAPSAPPSAAQLAAAYGLRPTHARPPLGVYLRQLWGRRHFIAVFATARARSAYSAARLGQLWQVLTPLLNATVYYLIFGLLLHTSRGVDNFIGFLTVGIFIFTYTQHSVLSGSRAISGNLDLIRALHFPRATLPIAMTLVELRRLGFSLLVMVVIVLATGEPLTWAWLTVLPVIVLQTLFNVGMSLGMARAGAQVSDVSQILPFLLRTWLYVSGVFYSISHFAQGAHPVIQQLMMINPAAVYIELVRSALLTGSTLTPYAWWYAVGWAVVVPVAGFWFFYRAEATYGRG